MRVVVDTDLCSATGECVARAPEVFSQDPEEGTVVLLDECPPSTLAQAVQDAEFSCPSGAITILKHDP